MKAPRQKLMQMCRAVALGAILWSVSGCSNSSSSPSVDKKTAPGKTNAAPATVVTEIVETNSVFDDKAQGGLDPFFPTSTRRVVAKTGAVAQRAVVKITPVLTLNSIVGNGSRRFALINNRTFARGETAMVRVPSGQVRVRCLDIQDRSVIVTVEGEPEQKILKLNQ